MGSTATVGLILLEEAERVLYISHVGDSCAYLFDDKGGEKTTPEHRVSNLS
jgi:serine/threonine protein phosphatase PrpC